VTDKQNIVELRVSEAWCPNDDDSGSIVLWIKSDGATVEKGDLIAEFMVAKITIELVAPASGILRTLVETEVAITKGDLLAKIHTY
jgi:pyruvate/2-oxoglutarate dehydrogenase complex dihydrolipoamide acyltransferase (E2) component